METISPSPEIAWGKNIYDPRTGDNIGGQLGITRIGIGNKWYNLKEDPNGQQKVESNEIPEPLDHSRIHLGFPDRGGPRVRVLATLEKPFSMDDPERLNKAADCAKKLAKIDRKFRSSLSIKSEGVQHVDSLKTLFDEEDTRDTEDTELLNEIAVLKEKMLKNINRDYPAEFLLVADAMEGLGITKIEVAETGKRKLGEQLAQWISFTPEHMREDYTPSPTE